MARKSDIKVVSYVRINGVLTPWSNLSDDSKEEYTKQIYRNLSSNLSRHLSDNPEEAERLMRSMT